MIRKKQNIVKVRSGFHLVTLVVFTKLRKTLTLVSERPTFPEQARNLAKALLDEMENKVCSSVQGVIAYTTHIYQRSLRIVGYLQAYQYTREDLKNAAKELHDFVRNEIGN